MYFIVALILECPIKGIFAMPVRKEVYLILSSTNQGLPFCWADLTHLLQETGMSFILRPFPWEGFTPGGGLVWCLGYSPISSYMYWLTTLLSFTPVVSRYVSYFSDAEIKIPRQKWPTEKGFTLTDGSRELRIFLGGKAWHQATGMAAGTGSWETTASPGSIKQRA